jgi:hypothetical protein
MMPPTICPEPASADMKVGRPVSAYGLGMSVMDACNHLLGNILGGLKVIQNSNGNPSVTDPAYNYKIYRHPNCDYVDIRVLFDFTSTQAGSWTGRAGTGAVQTRTFHSWGVVDGWRSVRCAYDSADTDDVRIQLSFTNCQPLCISIYDVPRDELGSADKRVNTIDTTHSRIGCISESFLAESDDTGPHRMIAAVEEAWDECKPQIIGWSVDESNAFSTASGSYVDVLGGAPINHQCKAKKSGTTDTATEWYVWAWADAGTTYALEVSSSVSGDSAEITGLTNTSGSFQSAISCDGANDQDETFLVKAKVTAGAGKAYVAGISSYNS